nr:hypothetical protein BaRGS_034960 [Batillaria attramentaria]
MQAVVAGRSKENVDEFRKAYDADPKRVDVQDNKGQRPLHVAATRGHQQIVQFIISQRHDLLDVVDNDGDTALHCAARQDQAAVVEALVTAGADTTVLNNNHMAPLHLACDLGNVNAVKALLRFPGVDRNIGGEMGMRPLHYCSIKDNAECAKLLLENGAKPCLKCDVGYFPIHIAAKCAAAATLEVLIQQAMKQGYERASLLRFKDKENNMPLHAAVNGGNIKAVEVCLNAGAPVDTQQDDKSTPLHLAAAQGNLEMISLMHELQPDNFSSALFTLDAMNRTPLHRAAVFNHVQVVDFLLQQGADIDSADSTDRTPLLLAASKGCWDTVQSLVRQGADIRVRDQNSRNYLHLAIRFGGKLDQFGCSFITDIKNLLNEKDEFGCTPLHYASREGHLLALDDLIRLGATLNPKNNDKQSPFHFATRYGRYNTCRRLLESAQGPSIINETDADGLTGLHIAAQNGHTKVLTLLLQKGACVHRDNDDNTPLHHAAAQGWTHCMRILLGIHANLLDVPNGNGDTALHVAAKHGQASAVTLLLTVGAAMERNKEEKTFFDHVIESKEADVALAVVKHDRWEEILLSFSGQYGCPFLGLIEHMPSICVTVLDRCQVESEHDKRSVDHYIEYNYKFLSCPLKCIEEMKQKGEFQPMTTLNAMVRHGRVSCLAHPVCVSFLKLKWNTYGLWFYTLFLGLYAVFLACLTYFVVNQDSLVHHDSGQIHNDTVQMLHGNRHTRKLAPFPTLAMWVVAVYSVLCMVKEVVQMVSQKVRYFTDSLNAFEWTLYILSLLFSAPFLLSYSFHWQWEAGALAIFAAWFNLLVILQRFDFFGIYVVMFLEILRTLLQALCVFSVLIIAFGLSFFMLLGHEDSRAYSTPQLSLMRTSMMMLEMDYMASFNEAYTDGDDTTLHFGNVTLLLLAVFVLLMPILLMNLLIGLAVGDIESVQRNARLKRLAGQVELHSDMERKMPLFLLARFDQPVYRYYPNKCKSIVETLWSRVTEADRDDQNAATDGMNRDAILEMYKQKQKLKDMSSLVEKNNQLLRLVVQKMEIHTEDEAWDEGLCSTGCSDDPLLSPDTMGSSNNRNLLSSVARNKLIRKTRILSHLARYSVNKK